MEKEGILLTRLNKLRDAIEQEVFCSHDEDTRETLEKVLEEDNKLAEETP